MCHELQILRQLENDDKCWLNIAKEMRNHSTHRHMVPREFHVGGEDEGKVTLIDPRDRVQVPGDQVAVFSSWLDEMTTLVKGLRSSALKEWRSKTLQVACLNDSRLDKR